MILREGAVLLIIGAAVITVGAERVLVSETPNPDAARCLSLAKETDFANEPHGFYKVYGADGLYERRSIEHWTKRCAATRKYKTETTAETCTRAMREIGAEKVLRFGPSKENPNGLITTDNMQGDAARARTPVETWWAKVPDGLIPDYWNDKYRVSCIPAPTGMK